MEENQNWTDQLYGTPQRLIEQLRISEARADGIKIVYERHARQNAQYIEILTQLAMHETQVSDAQKKLIAKALARHEEWGDALLEIASLDPAACGLQHAPLSNFKWLVAPAIGLPKQFLELLARRNFQHC